jgi:uroporphyrinogen-III decarboxylase
MSWRGGAKHLHLGDCAATMLSPGLYEKFSLRRYQKMMEDYKACTIHSCGPSGHLLDLFAEVPNPGILQLGAGTDLKDVRRKFPDSHICAYFSSPEILHGTPESIGKKLWEMAYVLEVDFQINGSSVDPETPRENIKAYLEAAMKVNEKFA